jgi:Alr-MurF fusion protein
MTVHPFPPQISFDNLITDSRTTLAMGNNLYIALHGANHNGHTFIQDLYQKGLRCFVVDSQSFKIFESQWLQLPEAIFYLVPNTLQALQQLAIAHRQQFNYPVIGITGSNGKTIVKEWLATLLSGSFFVVKSPKSYNSQVGVPLSVWQMTAQHTIAIFEAGISKPAEMTHLQKIIQPTIGVFTNIGPAHAEHFSGISEKISEKLQLYINAKTLIYCADQPHVAKAIVDFIKERSPQTQLLSWSLQGQGQVNYTLCTSENIHKLVCKTNEQEFTITVPFADRASIENLCHGITVMVHLGIGWPIIQAKTAQLKAVEMRLSIKAGLHNNVLIDDTYNMDLAGLKLALDYQQQHAKPGAKVCVFSDLLQTGRQEFDLYSELANILKQYHITQTIGVGPAFAKHASLFGNNFRHFISTEALLVDIEKLNIANSTLLVKGARKFGFEQIISRLEQKHHSTQLEIDLDAMVHNLNYFKSIIQPNTKIMAMVKAFAYGAGNVEVAQLLQHYKVDYLGVAYADEGQHLRQQGVHLPIMVLNPSPGDFERLLFYNLEPEIYSMAGILNLIEFMNTKTAFLKIHIKLDTGMHRLGFEPKDVELLCQKLQLNPQLIVASVFSHLAASENPSHDNFTHSQANSLQEGLKKITMAIGYRPMMHLLNTSGIARFGKYHFDMVRLGVGLYGVGNSDSQKAKLQTIGTLKTHISQIKEISTTDTVGYGRKGTVPYASKIATIAIGYADGYLRGFGNGNGFINVNGTLCPTIGNICMDMCMIDISNVAANEGDEVVVFGQNPSIYTLAEQLNTIPYEILTNIGERVKRVFVKQ